MNATSKVQLSLVLALLGVAEAKAQDEVLVLDFRFGTTTSQTITMDGTESGKPFEILGVQLGQAGSIIKQTIGGNSLLKKDGFIWKFEDARLACQGNVIVGVSTPYVEKLIAEKTTNDGKDFLKATFASPVFDNQALGVERRLTYARQDSAPTVDKVQEQLITKYGMFRRKRDHVNGHPFELKWEVAGGDLTVKFIYFDNRPGLLREVEFEMLRMERGAPFHPRPQEVQQICNQTQVVDQRRLKALNSKSNNAPPL